MDIDAEQARRFSEDFVPHCDMLLAHVNWDEIGGLYLMPCQVQNEVMSQIGRQEFIKLPKVGTNPRGVEISGKALDLMINHSNSRRISIAWQRKKIPYNPYDRWLELWQRD